jgi:ribosomal-protein-alanine N-acetyltransferase
MSIAVRGASRADVALLTRLHDACFDEKWNEEAIDTLLSAPGTFGFVAGNGGDWQSFVLARVAADEAEILSLGTAPSARRAGFGQALVAAGAKEAAARGAEKIFLEVSADNAPACALYAGLGFAEVGVRRMYYRHLDGAHADALTLAAALPLARQVRL